MDYAYYDSKVFFLAHFFDEFEPHLTSFFGVFFFSHLRCKVENMQYCNMLQHGDATI